MGERKRMPCLISVTRLRVRSPQFLPMFLIANERIVGQLRRSRGFRGGKQLIDRRLVFWTASSWEDEQAMKEFRSAGAHGHAMPRLPEWCDEAAVVHWEQETDLLPDWDAAYARLVGNGRASRVRHPSSSHQERRYRAPRVGPLQRRIPARLR